MTVNMSIYIVHVVRTMNNSDNSSMYVCNIIIMGARLHVAVQ